jgi:MerR family transcriptional regulator, mercuric resistance operon regulatory protein
VGQEFQAGTSQSLRIGELASRAAMTVDAIRFYEKRGLLPKAQRSTGHFRVYSPRDLERVRFIQQMQALGFSLREIRELVDLRDRKTDACETVRKLLHEKLATTRAKARQLKRLEVELLADLRKCTEELKHRRKHTPCPCPVLGDEQK